MESKFSSYTLIKAAGDGDDGEMYLSGPIADEDQVDLQNDILTKAAILSGLDFYKKAGGHIDYGHLFRKTHRPGYLIGKAANISPGPDGKMWLTAQLYKDNKYAQELFTLVKNGGHAGFSIDGICKARDTEDNRRIIKTEIYLIAADPMPIGSNNSLSVGAIPGGDLMSIVKSFVRKALDGEDDDEDIRMDGNDDDDDMEQDFTGEEERDNANGSGSKMTKEQAVYRKGVGGKMCRRCRFYQGAKCAKVQGDISPDGCCDYFRTKEKSGAEKPEEGMNKAMTTGSGIVQSGSTGGMALRGQELAGGSNRSDTRRRRRRRRSSDYDRDEMIKAYDGFKKLSGKLRSKGVKNAGALAAWIGRKKYGAKKFDEYAAEGESMDHVSPAKSNSRRTRGTGED